MPPACAIRTPTSPMGSNISPALTALHTVIMRAPCIIMRAAITTPPGAGGTREARSTPTRWFQPDKGLLPAKQDGVDPGASPGMAAACPLTAQPIGLH